MIFGSNWSIGQEPQNGIRSPSLGPGLSCSILLAAPILGQLVSTLNRSWCKHQKDMDANVIQVHVMVNLMILSEAVRFQYPH